MGKASMRLICKVVFRSPWEGGREGEGEILPNMGMGMHGVNWRLETDHLSMTECAVVGKQTLWNPPAVLL